MGSESEEPRGFSACRARAPTAVSVPVALVDAENRRCCRVPGWRRTGTFRPVDLNLGRRAGPLEPCRERRERLQRLQRARGRSYANAKPWNPSRRSRTRSCRWDGTQVTRSGAGLGHGRRRARRQPACRRIETVNQHLIEPEIGGDGVAIVRRRRDEVRVRSCLTFGIDALPLVLVDGDGVSQPSIRLDRAARRRCRFRSSPPAKSIRSCRSRRGTAHHRAKTPC